MASHRSRVSEGKNVVHEGTPGMETPSSLIPESSPYGQSLSESGVAKQCAKSSKWRSVNAAARATRHGPPNEPPTILLRYRYPHPCPSLQGNRVTKQRTTFAFRYRWRDDCAFDSNSLQATCCVQTMLHTLPSKPEIMEVRRCAFMRGDQLPISPTNRLVVA